MGSFEVERDGVDEDVEAVGGGRESSRGRSSGSLKSSEIVGIGCEN